MSLLVSLVTPLLFSSASVYISPQHSFIQRDHMWSSHIGRLGAAREQEKKMGTRFQVILLPQLRPLDFNTMGLSLSWLGGLFFRSFHFCFGLAQQSLGNRGFAPGEGVAEIAFDQKGANNVYLSGIRSLIIDHH